MSQSTRDRMGRAELGERVIEAALDQKHPSDELRDSLQRFLTFTKHRLRDRTREEYRAA